MSCSNCNPFMTPILIQSLDQLREVATKVRDAVSRGILKYNSFESDRELIGQPSFMDIDFGTGLPDAIRYHFNCPICGNCFALCLETHHGSEGKWYKTGRLPKQSRLQRLFVMIM